MKKILHNILKFLPIILVVVMVMTPNTARANWLQDKFDSVVQYAKSVKNIAGTCNGDMKCMIAEGAALALGLVPTEDCPAPVVEDTACLFCPLFQIIFMASSGVAKASYELFHSDLGTLILIFLAVSLALIILKNVASMGAKEPGTLLNDIFTKAFVCVATFVIITQDYFNILNMTITPLIKDGLSFVGVTDDGNCRYVGIPGGFSDQMGVFGGEALPSEIGALIICAIDNIEQKINALFSYGEYAFCLGTGPDKIYHILPHPVYILDAVFLYIGGLFFLIGYPWILADAVIQLGISFALLPFAIAGYGFRGTKNYLSKLIQWILHSLFVFIFMAILINCVLGYVANLLGLIFNTTGDSDMLFTDPNNGIAFFGPNMVKIIFILTIGWVYMPIVRDLAGNFAKGSSLSAANAFGTVLRDNMEKAAERVGEWGTGAAQEAVAATARVTGRRVNALNRRIMAGVTNTFGHVDPSTGLNTFSIGGRHAPKWLAGGMQFQTETAPDGSQILKREFTSITGRKHVMISDRYSTIKEEYEKDPATGVDKLVRREVKFKHSFVKKHLLNEKGQVNTDAVQALFNSSIGQNPAYRQAIMEQLGADILKTKGKEVGNYFVSRNVTYDAADPYKISVEQIDHSGKTTKYTLDFNMTTGQTAVSYAQSYGKNKQDVDVFFSNGVVDIQTTAERDAYGRVTSEVTKFRYSADAKKGHDSMFIDDDSNQIVDDSGTIASNLAATTSSGAQNPYNLLYGMDNIAGVTSVGGVSTSAYMLDNVLRRGRLNRSNKIRTNLSGSFI